LKYYIDIDGTICTHEKDGHYENAKPYMNRIEIINKLYNQCNEIIYWTARGTTTGIDWREETTKQFNEWGVKFHELKFGKPAYAMLIDNQAMSDREFFGDIND
jgi:GH35 family endo-1,4-beta-xylanase